MRATLLDKGQRFMDRDLRAAVETGGLELHYQPICDTFDLRLVAFESLARWPDPTRGMVSPTDFIRTAERSTLIDDVGDWVLRQACEDSRKLGARYVGVNVSAIQLRRDDFAVRFATILRRARVDPATITVEITETVKLRSDGAARRNLGSVRDLGCYVAVDDFGAGHATLEYFALFPFNVLKIDKTHVSALETSDAARTLVEAACEFGASTGIVVVAEGVETGNQLRFLREIGCPRVQGYLIARPAPLSAWLAEPRLETTRL